MNKLKKLVAALMIVSAVGISYALFTLRGLPDVFDWEDEKNE